MLVHHTIPSNIDMLKHTNQTQAGDLKPQMHYKETGVRPKGAKLEEPKDQTHRENKTKHTSGRTREGG